DRERGQGARASRLRRAPGRAFRGRAGARGGRRPMTDTPSGCAAPQLSAQLVDFLDRPDPPLSPQLSAHVERCSQCAEDWRQMRESWTALAALKVAAPSQPVLARAHAAGLGAGAPSVSSVRVWIAQAVGVAAAIGMAIFTGVPAGALAD